MDDHGSPALRHLIGKLADAVVATHADFGDPARQALAGDRGLAPGDTVATAGVDQDRTREGAALIANHPRRDEAQARVGNHVGEAAQRRVLGFQPAPEHLPVPEPLVLALERGIPGAQLGQLADAFDRVTDRIDGTGDKFEDRRGRVADRAADPLDEDGVGLAYQH